MYQLRVNVQAMKESHATISSKANTSQYLLYDREVNYSASTSVSTRDPQRLIALGKSCTHTVCTYVHSLLVNYHVRKLL